MKRIVAKVGEYTNKEGEVKGEYVNIGVIMSNDNGEFVLIDPKVSLSGVHMQQRAYNHASGKKMGDRVMCGVFSDDNSKSAAKPAAKPEIAEEDIPF